MNHKHDIESIDHARIPMRDGCELAARIWLPAILEYIPYRLRDWQVHFNLGTNEAVLTVIDHDGRFRLDDTGVALDYEVDERYSYASDEYDTVRGEAANMRRLERGDWSVTLRTRTVLTSDARNYYLHARVEAWEAQERVFVRDWDEVVPRDG